jgi:dGTPase
MGLVNEQETTELFAELMGDRFKPEKLNRIAGSNERIGLLRAVSIGILIDQCAHVFLEHQPQILDGTFDKALIDLIPARETLGAIISISIEKLYQSDLVLEIEAGGFEVLGGLLELYANACYHYQFEKSLLSKKELSIFRLLPENTRMSIAEETSVYGMLRHILDFVSGLTDRHAVSIYRKLKGISLAGWAG